MSKSINLDAEERRVRFLQDLLLRKSGRPASSAGAPGTSSDQPENAPARAAANAFADMAADLSGNSRVAELIRCAAPHFDWIIVDSSPVNVVSDAVNLVPACDGVLLVTRGGQTSYQTAQRAQKEFGSANLLGVVLNGAAEVPHQSYYGYGTEPDQQ